jgi:hypothetical protein
MGNIISTIISEMGIIQYEIKNRILILRAILGASIGAENKTKTGLIFQKKSNLKN